MKFFECEIVTHGDVFTKFPRRRQQTYYSTNVFFSACGGGTGLWSRVDVSGTFVRGVRDLSRTAVVDSYNIVVQVPSVLELTDITVMLDTRPRRSTRTGCLTQLLLCRYPRIIAESVGEARPPGIAKYSATTESKRAESTGEAGSTWS